MKKTVSVLAATAIALTGMATASVTPAVAQSENAASIEKDVGCSGFVPGGIGLFTTETRSITTSSGNTKLVCHFDIPEGFEPETAVSDEGFGCNTFLGFTTDSRMVATPGGRALLTCEINGSTD